MKLIEVDVDDVSGDYICTWSWCRWCVGEVDVDDVDDACDVDEVHWSWCRWWMWGTWSWCRWCCLCKGWRRCCADEVKRWIWQPFSGEKTVAGALGNRVNYKRQLQILLVEALVVYLWVVVRHGLLARAVGPAVCNANKPFAWKVSQSSHFKIHLCFTGPIYGVDLEGKTDGIALSCSKTGKT